MNYLEIYFNGVLKQSLPIKTDTFTIGRASDNEVVIENMGVSSHHAVMTKKGGVFFIQDLNSTNGTFLNSQKISSEQQVNAQDSIIIGKHTIKFSEWSQTKEAESASSVHESNDATVMMSRSKPKEINEVAFNSSTLESNDATMMVNSSKVKEITETTQTDSQQIQFHLIIRGELSGIKKLLLTENSYGIGKAKDNAIRIGGMFTSAYIADIEKIGHSFYIIPLQKNKVKLNDKKINDSTILTPSDRIKIKNLFIRFSNE